MTITHIIYGVFFLFSLIQIMVLMRLFQGLTKPFKAHALSIDNKNDLMKDGISHKTSRLAKQCINKEKLVRKSNSLQSYSTQFHKCTFFFSNTHMDKKSELYNENSKYEVIMYIRNLSETQIENFKIRDFDNAVMYNTDFKIEEYNTIEWIDLNKKNSNRFIYELKRIIEEFKSTPVWLYPFFILDGIVSMAIVYSFYILIYIVIKVILK